MPESKLYHPLPVQWLAKCLIDVLPRTIGDTGGRKQ